MDITVPFSPSMHNKLLKLETPNFSKILTIRANRLLELMTYLLHFQQSKGGTVYVYNGADHIAMKPIDMPLQVEEQAQCGWHKHRVTVPKRLLADRPVNLTVTQKMTYNADMAYSTLWQGIRIALLLEEGGYIHGDSKSPQRRFQMDERDVWHIKPLQLNR